MTTERPEAQTAGAQPGQPFSVMVKPVGAVCNMRCNYCYYLNPDADGGIATMSDEVLEAFIEQYTQAGAGGEVSFVWHGGEPTLAGIDFYARVVALQAKHAPPGTVCRNNLQTNGILLDEAWCAFLAEHRFDVGLSVDGTAALHDANRLDCGGSGTYARVAAALGRLQAHGIQPDLLCTVHAATAEQPQAVYQALRSFETGWMQFIPVVRRDAQGNVTADSVTAQAYGGFLCAVFDAWVSDGVGTVDIQLFAEAMRILEGGAAGLCMMAPTCGRALIVEMDGSVYTCDHFVDKAHKTGNILQTHLRELANCPAQVAFGNAKRDALAAKCQTCVRLALCGGGCPKDRFVPCADRSPDLYCLCTGLLQFYHHAQAGLQAVADEAKRGYILPTAAILARMTEASRAAWSGVGRNDACPCGSGLKAKRCCWDRRL